MTSRSLYLLVALAGMAQADPPADVAALVKQLGDPKYARREAAQRELLTRSEDIVPELDRLARGADPETAERLRKVRYALVWYREDVRQMLAGWKDSDRSALPPALGQLIGSHQPRSGNFLLSLSEQPGDRLADRAGRAFVQTSDTASAAQVERFLRQCFLVGAAAHRPAFPAGVGAVIPTFASVVWDGDTRCPAGGIPTAVRTQATRYLDGRPHGDPLRHEAAFTSLAYYRAGDLSQGKHAIHAVLEYEFTHRGEKRRGEVRSPTTHFEVLPADTPDDLAAPKSESLAAKVRAALVVRDFPRLVAEAVDGFPPVAETDGDWSATILWDTGLGHQAAVSCPAWALADALDVDLCFDAELHDVKSGKAYPCQPVCVRRGETRRGRIVPDDPKGLVGGRDGVITVKVVLKPSRALALSDPKVTRYFAEPITTGELRMKVFAPSIPPAK